MPKVCHILLIWMFSCFTQRFRKERRKIDKSSKYVERSLDLLRLAKYSKNALVSSFVKMNYP